MSYIRIIPSLLLSEKKLVKGVKFKNHKNAGSPITSINALDSQNCDEIFLIDLDSYKNKVKPDYDILNKISEISSSPITFGGGINSLEKAEMAFASGADKVYLNNIIFNKPELISEIAKKYGNQSIISGINIVKENDDYFILEDSKKKINPIKYSQYLEDIGSAEIKITFVNLEGTKKNLDIDYAVKIKEKVNIPCIYEGGIGKLEDISVCIKNGIDSIAIGTMIIFSDCNIIKIKHFLKNLKYKVRV